MKNIIIIILLTFVCNMVIAQTQRLLIAKNSAKVYVKPTLEEQFEMHTSKNHKKKVPIKTLKKMPLDHQHKMITNYGKNLLKRLRGNSKIYLYWMGSYFAEVKEGNEGEVKSVLLFTHHSWLEHYSEPQAHYTEKLQMYSDIPGLLDLIKQN